MVDIEYESYYKIEEFLKQFFYCKLLRFIKFIKLIFSFNWNDFRNNYRINYSYYFILSDESFYNNYFKINF